MFEYGAVVFVVLVVGVVVELEEENDSQVQ